MSCKIVSIEVGPGFEFTNSTVLFSMFSVYIYLAQNVFKSSISCLNDTLLALKTPNGVL